jgi:hypothetical protein
MKIVIWRHQAKAAKMKIMAKNGGKVKAKENREKGGGENE